MAMANVNLYMYQLVTKFRLYLLLTLHITTEKSVDIHTTSFSNKNCFKLFLSAHSLLWEFLNLIRHLLFPVNLTLNLSTL